MQPFAVTPGVTLPVGDYSFGQARATFQLSAARKVSGFVSFTVGEFYDGTILETSWRGRVEFSSQLSAEPTISFNHVETPHGTGDTNVIGSRVTYTLTPRMFVAALIQYQSAAKTATSNVRFRWEYQPGSELFVVYSDGRDTNNAGFPPPILNRSFVVRSRSCSGCNWTDVWDHDGVRREPGGRLSPATESQPSYRRSG